MGDRDLPMTELVAVEDLVEGMLVDLEGDPYADPNHDEVSYPFELAQVLEVIEELPDCTSVVFDASWVGFPHGYQVKVEGMI